MTRSAVAKARMTKLSLLGVGALVALTGCTAGLHPGAAAVVGGQIISEAKVDDVAQALCSANVGGAKARGEAAPEMASRGARQGALQILLENELSRQFGARKGVQPSQRQVSAALAQSAEGIALLPESERPAFKEALKEYAEGQLILIDVGRASLRAQGRSNVTDDQALAEGNRLRERYVKSIDVEVDPRFGTFTGGSFHAGGTSLSVPASADARAASKADPAQSWVTTLPASQKCG